MGSWVLVRMGIRWQISVCVVIAVVGVIAEGDDDGRTYGWSALSFLSSQNNKRSADDAKENNLMEDYDMSASESKIEAEPLIASEPDPESRMEPYRRRRNKYRTKKRKNRYEQNQVFQAKTSMRTKFTMTPTMTEILPTKRHHPGIKHLLHPMMHHLHMKHLPMRHQPLLMRPHRMKPHHMKHLLMIPQATSQHQLMKLHHILAEEAATVSTIF